MNNEFQPQSPLLSLPKELRIAIYNLAFASQKPLTVGNRAVNDTNTTWPLQPCLSRVSRALRNESLGMHYATAHFYLNVQRPSGEAIVLAWIELLSRSCPEAFNKLGHVTVVTGLGHAEPSKEYTIDLQRCHFISSSRPCAAAYLYTRRCNMRLWTTLVSGALRKRLRVMPGKDSPKFSVAENLRSVIAIVGESSGYELDSDLFWLPSVDGTALAKPSPTRYQEGHCPLLELPKELRLTIYEYVLAAQSPITVGQRALTNTPTFHPPPLTRVNSRLRRESLPLYLSTSHFILNIHRTPCKDVVIEWLHHCARAYPDAFPHLRYVSVIAGAGIGQPPWEYEFDLSRNKLLSAIMRTPTDLNHLAPHKWTSPPWEMLLSRLRGMPEKCEAGEQMLRKLVGIVDVLARYSV